MTPRLARSLSDGHPEPGAPTLRNVLCEVRVGDFYPIPSPGNLPSRLSVWTGQCQFGRAWRDVLFSDHSDAGQDRELIHLLQTALQRGPSR